MLLKKSGQHSNRICRRVAQPNSNIGCASSVNLALPSDTVVKHLLTAGLDKLVLRQFIDHIRKRKMFADSIILVLHQSISNHPRRRQSAKKSCLILNGW